MTKFQTLEAIERAKLAHIEQMEKIDLMLRGVSVENPTSISKVECDFGQWLYGDNTEPLKHLLGVQFYNELDREHEEWHVEYTKIYDLLLQKQSRGFFAKIFHTSSVDPLVLDKAKTYYVELEKITEKLLHSLEKSERRLAAINTSKFV